MKGSLDRNQKGKGGKNYLEVIQDNTLDKKHPRHNGIEMQAHHLLTVSGVKDSKVADELIKAGYNINWIRNIVFLPSTLKGACHLGVQPHRGDHKTAIKILGKDSLDDDGHPFNYHRLVRSKVEKGIADLVNRDCPDLKLILKEMDKISKEVLDLIQNRSDKAPLTSIANFRFFNPGSHLGCANETSVTIYKKKADEYGVAVKMKKERGTEMKCSKERNHYGEQDEKKIITYPKPKGRYVLEAGK